MKITKLITTGLLMAFLTGCGGGGESSATGSGENGSGGGGSGSGSGGATSTTLEDTVEVITNIAQAETIEEQLAIAANAAGSASEFAAEAIDLYTPIFMATYVEPVYNSPIVEEALTYLPYLSEPWTMEDLNTAIEDNIDFTSLLSDSAFTDAIETYYNSVQNAPSASSSLTTETLTTVTQSEAFQTLMTKIRESFVAKLKVWFDSSFLADAIALYNDLPLLDDFNIDFIDTNDLPEETPLPESTNTAPTAVSKNVTLEANSDVSITLQGSDIDGDDLTYSFTNPGHGTLTGTAPYMTYTPATNYEGADSFTFKTNDGQAYSETATVSITVTPETSVFHTAPDAYNNSGVTLNQGENIVITLTGKNYYGLDSSLIYSVVRSPIHGNFDIATNTYTPDSNYFGSDSFTFRAFDGTEYSNVATVSITINEVIVPNNAPTALAQSISLEKNDIDIAITLQGNDTDGDALSYSVVAGPTHGSLDVSPGIAVDSPFIINYTPDPNYTGADSFTYRAYDGQAYSSTATVSLNIEDTAPLNTAPSASSQSVSLDQDTPKSITLSGTDAEGDTLTYTIVSNPSHGSLSGTGANRTYTPDNGYSGSDSFTFKVNDGSLDSATATVSISVAQVVPATPVFTSGLLGTNTFYVKSNVTDMTVKIKDGSNGTGSMGFLSMSFTYSITNDGILIVDSSSMGIFDIVATYIDEGYCIAADATDEDGVTYESYWFTNQSDYNQATSLTAARSLCLKNQ